MKMYVKFFDNTNITKVSIDPNIKYTVFMVSKNRNGYYNNMDSFVKIMDPNSEFIVFDIESDKPLKLKKKYKDMKNVKLIRKEKKNNENSSGGKLNFSIWESWAFAMNNIRSKRIFYFDNCNEASENFKFENYMEGSYYFPNQERWYTQNFATDRFDILIF
jgi:hypothetical protein